MIIKQVYVSNDGVEFSTEELALKRDEILKSEEKKNDAFKVYDDLSDEYDKLLKTCTHADILFYKEEYYIQVTCRVCSKKWNLTNSEFKNKFNHSNKIDVRKIK